MMRNREITDNRKRTPHRDTLETYECVCLSTAHLSPQALEDLADNIENGMVMSRDTGWFIKMYQEWECNCWCECPDLRILLFWAWTEGFGMVEFDADAEVIKMFDTFTAL